MASQIVSYCVYIMMCIYYDDDDEEEEEEGHGPPQFICLCCKESLLQHVISTQAQILSCTLWVMGYLPQDWKNCQYIYY